MVLLPSLLPGQSYFSRSYEFGENDFPEDEIFRSITVEDTLYFVAYRHCAEGSCITVVKTDPNGSIWAERHFNWMHLGLYSKNTIIHDGDKILISGLSGIFSEAKYELLVLNTNLDSVDHQSYSPDENLIGMANRSLIAFDDYYVIIGFSQLDESTYPSKMFWINKDDLSLDTIITVELDEKFTSFEEAFIGPDSLLTIAYLHHKENIFQVRGFLKFNKNKEIVWQWAGEKDSFRRRENALVLQNGNMVIEQAAPDLYGEYELLCINPAGEQLWSLAADYSPFGRKFIYNLNEAANGDILGCGRITWPWPYDTTQWPPMPEVYTTAYVFRVGPDGQLLWERAFFDYAENGNISSHYFLDIHELSDGSLLMTGRYKDYYSTVTTDYETDSWVVRTDADGCIFPDCEFWAYTTTATDEAAAPGREKLFAIFGNPAKELLQVRMLRENLPVGLTWSVLSVEGRVLATQETGADDISAIEISRLPPGTYYLTLNSSLGQVLQTEKFVRF